MTAHTKPAIEELFERRLTYPDFAPQERLARLVGVDDNEALRPIIYFPIFEQLHVRSSRRLPRGARPNASYTTALIERRLSSFGGRKERLCLRQERARLQNTDAAQGLEVVCSV
jgi:hypothetical protein